MESFDIVHFPMYGLRKIKKYNKDNPDPLYLIQGVWVNDYVLNSHHNIYDDEFCENFYNHCKAVVDVICVLRRAGVNKPLQLALQA